VVHCAAERKPDVCDNNEALTVALNVDVTKHVANAAAAASAWLVYVSTDYVFDGTEPPYKASATPNPLSLYGNTKWLGEIAAREIKADTGILRVGVLYSHDVETLDESAVTALLSVARSAVGAEKPVLVDDWALRYPMHVDDVAYAILCLSERKVKFCGFSGTFHLCGSVAITKYGMAKLFAELDGIDANLAANSEPTGTAKRPKDARLDCRALELMGFVKRTPLKDGLAPVVARFPKTQ